MLLVGGIRIVQYFDCLRIREVTRDHGYVQQLIDSQTRVHLIEFTGPFDCQEALIGNWFQNGNLEWLIRDFITHLLESYKNPRWLHICVCQDDLASVNTCNDILSLRIQSQGHHIPFDNLLEEVLWERCALQSKLYFGSFLISGLG
jgi:hypothetical protein